MGRLMVEVPIPFFFPRFLPVVLLLMSLIGAIGTREARAQAGAPDPLFQRQWSGAREMVLLPDGKIILIRPDSTSLVRIGNDGIVDPSFKMRASEDNHAFSSLICRGNHLLLLRDHVLSRYLFNGQPDPAFSVSPALTFTGYLPLADGQIAAWGASITRFREDGTPDSIFHAPLFSGGVPSYLQEGEKGSLYVWGTFTTVNHQPHPGLVRLNRNGTIDQGFVPALEAGFQVGNLRRNPAGNVIVTGVTASGRGAAILLKPDGSFDPALWNPGLSIFSSVAIQGMLITDEGKILLGGGFTPSPGAAALQLVRLNADGTVDSSFNCPLAGGTLRDVIPQAGGKLLLAGRMYTQNGTVPLLRLNGNGTIDGAFDLLPENQVSNLYSTIAGPILVQPDGKIVASLQGYDYIEPPGGVIVTFGSVFINHSGTTLTTANATGVTGASLSGIPLSTSAKTSVIKSEYFTFYRLVRYLGDGPYPPHHITQLSVNSLTPSLTRLQWNPTASVTTFRIERLDQIGNWTLLGRTSGKLAYYNDRRDKDSTFNYSYRVVAENGYGEAVPSPVASASRPYGFTLTGTVTTPRQVDLTWTPSFNQWRYEVYRGESYYDREKIATLPSSAGSYRDTTVRPLHHYIYEVRAINLGGYTSVAFSADVPYDHSPKPPAIFLTAAAGPGQARILWKPSLYATGYRLERNDGKGWVLAATLDAKTTSYLDTELTVGKSYQYRIASFDLAGSSSVTDANRVLIHRTGDRMEGELDTSFQPNIALESIDQIQISNGVLYFLKYRGSDSGLLPMGKINLQGRQLTYAPPFDLVYNPRSGYNDRALFSLLPDGGALVYCPLPGDFGERYYDLIRLNSHGVRDENFSAPIIRDYTDYYFDYYSQVSQILPLRNGDCLLLGWFDTFDYNRNCYGLLRLKADGSRDKDFNLLPVLGNDVMISVVEQTDGKLILAQGTSVYRLLANGKIDSTFGRNGRVTFQGPNDSYYPYEGSVKCLTLQPDGRILVGGDFDLVNDQGKDIPINALVRLTTDGRIDPTLHVGLGFNPIIDPDYDFYNQYSEITGLKVDAKGRIIVLGDLLKYDDITCNAAIIRLQPDGLLDPAFFLPNTFNSNNFTLSPDNKSFYAGATLRRYYYGP